MSDIEEEVLRAAADLGLPEAKFRKCGAAEAADVVSRAKSTFVVGDPRSWWLSLKHASASHPYDTGGHELLVAHVPAHERRCWFIPETEEELPPVFECDVDTLAPVLSDCFSFEYYVVGKGFEWLIIDTDHNELIVCSSPHVAADP